jgi:DNA-binding MarR family transcriptional regulator
MPIKNLHKNTEKVIAKTRAGAHVMGLLQGKAYSRLHTNLSRTLVRHDISIPEWKLLGQVGDHQGIKLSNLAEILGYDPPLVTKLVKQLEKKRLVHRVASQTDERAKIITITSKGSVLLNTIEPEVRLLLRGILSGITAAELQVYKKVLQTIIQNTDS